MQSMFGFLNQEPNQATPKKNFSKLSVLDSKFSSKAHKDYLLNNHTVIDELEELKVDQKQKSEGQRKSSEMEDNDFNNREEEKKGVQLNFDSNSSSANKRKGAKGIREES